MTQKYDIESLIETFNDHAEKNYALRMITLEANPDSEWAKEDFCISRALCSICISIKEIQDDMEFLRGDD